MSDNALVADAATDDGFLQNLDAPNDATNGLKVIDGAADAADAFGRGDWIEGSVNGLSAGIDVVGAVLDPIGTIGSCIAGWLIEHLGPVQDWLDELLGDPGSITAASTTWHNVSTHLSGVGNEYAMAARGDLSGQQGLAVAAYGRFADLQGGVIDGMSHIADAVGAGVALAGTVLAGVREFISSTLADLVGQIVKLIGETVFTLGLGAPHAFATAANKCREMIQRTRTFMDDLARSLDRMAGLLGDISPALESGATALAKVSRHASSMGEHELNFLVSMGKAGGQTDDETPYAFA